jgi:hypothetical protein
MAVNGSANTNYPIGSSPKLNQRKTASTLPLQPEPVAWTLSMTCSKRPTGTAS